MNGDGMGIKWLKAARSGGMPARSIHRNESRDVQVGKCKAALRFSAWIKRLFRSVFYENVDCSPPLPFFLK